LPIAHCYSTSSAHPKTTNSVSGGNINTDTADHSEHAENHTESAVVRKPKKTLAEMDEELRMKMSGLAGDGGEAGVEMEDGQPVAMKRSVKANMFRYI